MVFSSPTFLFLFLPIVLWLRLLLRDRISLQNTMLVIASLFFYSAGDGAHLTLLLGSIAFNFACGLALLRGGAFRRKLTLAVGLAVNLALLVAFKYAGFLVDLVNTTVGDPVVHLAPIPLPVGISFFTFHSMSYLIDVSRGKTPPQQNLLTLTLYIALFPQLIAGPIVRYGDIAEQLRARVLDKEGLAEGIRRFTIGLAKKVLIADVLAPLVQDAFGDPTHAPEPVLAWLGALAFMAQLYYDFSGYSDMAIGLGRMFGFHFKENFAHPYTAASVSEFWRRWHISLSTWFRDYLYIPLGGNRRGALRRSLNLWTVFLLCGLWHGASTSFLAWGAYHGAFLVLERTRWQALVERTPSFVRILCTQAVVLVGWVLFRANTLRQAFAHLGSMGSLASVPMSGPDGVTARIAEHVDRLVGVVLVVAFIGASPRLLSFVRQRLERSRHRWLEPGLADATCVVLLLACMLDVAATTFHPFLYFRF